MAANDGFPLKVRTTKLWNSLTQDVTEPKSINQLQGGLDKLMQDPLLVVKHDVWKQTPALG